MEKTDIITLMQLPDVGSKTVLKLYNHVSNRRLINLDFNDYISLIEEITNKKFMGIQIDKSKLKAEKLLEQCYLNKIKIFSFLDDDYPNRLKKIGNDKPVILFSKGNHDIMKTGYNLAFIGSRKVSKENYKIGVKFSKLAVDMGVNIISGLAIGCDTAGHRGALLTNKNLLSGKTLAVLPSGIQNIYPKKNTTLSNEILEEEGCLISEKPPFESPEKYDYIMRDRLQAALSESIFILQSSLGSGTVHTAKFGEKYSKKIFCYGINTQNKGMELNKKLINEGKAFDINSEEQFKLAISKERDEHYEISH